MSILINILTIVLVLVSVFMILLVLMQRGNANGGLGAAMGGGMAESALGAETSSVLSRWTRNVGIVFFVLSFGLYLGNLHYRSSGEEGSDEALPTFEDEQPQSSEETNALQDLISNTQEQVEAAKQEAEQAGEEATQAVEDGAEAMQEQADEAADETLPQQ